MVLRGCQNLKVRMKVPRQSVRGFRYGEVYGYTKLRRGYGDAILNHQTPMYVLLL